MEPSIFTKIIERKIPAEIIYEDEHTIAILDKFPSMEGQMLVIPKHQEAYVFNLPDHEYHALMTTTKKVALALDRAFKTDRTCIIIEGFEVPHVHVRLYPCLTSLIVWSPRSEASSEILAALAKKIKNAMT
jgi:histidine triad (HIT) family protein